MSDRPTPETDHLEVQLGPAAMHSHPILWEHSRQLERERDEARNQRDILRLDAQREAEHHDRMVGELEKVYAERDEAREKCANLHDIAERMIEYVGHTAAYEKLRAELAQLKEGAK